MKKRNIVIGVICFLLIVTGCQNQGRNTYSNLSDSKTQDEVAHIFSEHGIEEKQVDQVFGWIRAYNELVQKGSLQSGFTSLPNSGVDYSSIILDDSKSSYSYIEWLNCRLSAFYLLKGHLQSARLDIDPTSWLMFDLEAINELPEYQLSSVQLKDFINVFAPVPVKEHSSLEDHKAAIQNAWKERNIQIDLEKVSLVSVYIHVPQKPSVRFVGHTGVLIEEENELLFFEKYSNLDPFQVSRFPDRNALKKYLLSRKDLYGDSSELEPIIMENGEFLE